MPASQDEVLEFWFGPANPPLDGERFQQRARLWFFKDAAVDREITERFGADVERAARGELDAWAETARGRLALIVLLDQFPRNMFRGSARAFAYDDRSRALALEGLAKGVDKELSVPERFIFYLPLVHTEDRALQDVAVGHFERLVADAPPDMATVVGQARGHAERHREIIVRFGRFPHRNEALGRASTEEELAFLKEPNSSY